MVLKAFSAWVEPSHTLWKSTASGLNLSSLWDVKWNHVPKRNGEWLTHMWSSREETDSVRMCHEAGKSLHNVCSGRLCWDVGQCWDSEWRLPSEAGVSRRASIAGYEFTTVQHPADPEKLYSLAHQEGVPLLGRVPVYQAGHTATHIYTCANTHVLPIYLY